MKAEGGERSIGETLRAAVAELPIIARPMQPSTLSESTGSMLIDSFGRIHRDLRISVTDRCNIRCFYCMPEGTVQFKPRSELLTFEEIERFVSVAVSLGIRKLRLTGGEPLVRQDLHVLVGRLASLPGIVDVALTTNGILLTEQARALRDAGLHRLNISLDTLRPDAFRQISRRDGLERVLEGIAAAQRVGFEKIKLNAVAIKDLTEPDVVPLATFAREHGLELRFIEYMPLDADGHWSNDQVLSGRQIMAMLEDEFGPLEVVPVANHSQPATDYRYTDHPATVGFINPVTQPFCGDCDRLRLTAEGQVRNCLFSTVEWDARALLRGGASDDKLRQLLHASVAAKKAGHGINSDEFVKPQRAMFQIGG